MGLGVKERIHKRAAEFEEIGRKFKGRRTPHKVGEFHFLIKTMKLQIEKRSVKESKDAILEFTRQLGIAPQ